MAAKRRSSVTKTLPAPVQGLNLVEPLAGMNQEYASILDNVFCNPTDIQIRKGYESWATFTGTAETIFSYEKMTGATELYAAVKNGANYYIYDITSTGAVGAAKVSGLASARWKYEHFSTSGGLFLYIVNGVNTPYVYDGSTWQSVTAVSAPFAITGVTTTLLKDVKSFKRRLWFVEKESLSCWYLPVDSLGGLAVEYDFTPIFAKGGSITKIDTWTLDAGYGVDDYFVIFTSNGEVAVYRGTDPASATTWALTGVFNIGSPVGLGHTAKYGGDLLLLNSDGVAQLSTSLVSDRVNNRTTISSKIQPFLSQYAVSNGTTFGWDIELYPPANMLIVNIPTSSGTFYQMVMNTISGAWSRWTGISASCWKFSKEVLYFGSSGAVYKMWSTQADAGTNIVADILPAYNSFGSTSQAKMFTLARFIVAYDGAFNYGVRMELDFNQNPNTVTMPLSLSQSVGIYGTSTYGSAVYGGELTVRKHWKNVYGIGYWGSPHLRISTKNSDVRVYSMDIIFELGGNL